MDPQLPTPRRSLPRSIGRYRIIDRLGKGAMGVVYSAHDGLMERTVAIKIMMTDFEDDPETSARFYREARSAGQLLHPNIITIFDLGEDDGRPFIVMELLEGQTLNKYLERPEAADVATKIDLMLQICSGLHAAHRRSIIHRDVKPGNLLVSPNGELKIVDFGIARLASSNMTASGLIVGTPDYMSPEQAAGREVDTRSDIFSAGAVFYLMLTGRKPFAASDLTSVLYKVQSEAPLPIRDSEAPPALAKLVMKALAKQPADRYQSCARMIAELEHLKRDLEAETALAHDECQQRLQTFAAAAQQHRRLIAALDIVPEPEDVEAIRVALLEKYALLSEPYRRQPVLDLLAEVRRRQEASAAAIEAWERARQSVDEGLRAVAQSPRDALAHFEQALRIEPASRRASSQAERCRGAIAAQRATDERAQGLLAEARKAAAAKEWKAVVTLCDDILLLDGRVEEAAALKHTAAGAINAEARKRKIEVEKAIARADAYRQQKRFAEATREIARARELEANAEVDAAEERLRVSIDQEEREVLLGRQTADAIAAARAAFSSGRRDEAIAGLRSFYQRVPHAMVGTELDRLEEESKRIAAAEQRAAEAAEQAKAAEAALTGGTPDQALDLAKQALAIDPGHLLARKVAGLARAEIQRRADARARADKAARLLDEAQQQLVRHRFDKARALVSEAAGLDPTQREHAAMLARIQHEEALVAEEADRQRLAKQKAKAVAPILDLARAAEARRDYARAAWTAENALAVDIECVEAKEILQRSRAQLDANPAIEDDTVDLTNGTGVQTDPDATVSLARPLGLWERVSSAVKRWVTGGTGTQKNDQRVAAHRMKT